MSVNPISERQIIVLTTDGRLSLIELEGAASLLLNKENRIHNISRPIMCLEDMIPGKNSIKKSQSELIVLLIILSLQYLFLHTILKSRYIRGDQHKL